ncbi:AraC family transcriptional regulator [Streptomyces sp. WM6373]|uniref:helix-turn-helix transcriptional regulator n=1 Tax=Streptomyces TaxID=1883 RepID=UPI0006AFA11E|nr:MULTISPECIES: AraC family transcriptional regulator [unclassified Streptomyces]KOU35954.1 AraC family transcriptional regulator [Streptomyces sp. WM6373]KOU70413.1 AraC family transcriptional regulator [Streptomyces sp. IGB124]KOU75605.1 AraC family transcriptional regulator [Streptomyces sp. XY66]KOU93798.1 AraC family transcriptional regulator [Streptomyces sp. XY58]KOV07995.1 AraC family transcriptional regulator [Streptomyces sp. XY37]
MTNLFFESGNLEATEAFLSAAYTPMQIGGRPADTRARISRTEVGGLSVDRLSFGYTMGYDAGCLGKVCLVTMHSGTIVDTTGGREEVFGPGETFLLAPHDRPYEGQVRQARYTITMFDPRLLGRVASVPGGKDVRITGARAVGPAENRRLGAAVAYLRDHVLDDSAVSADPDGLFVSTAAQHLAATVLATLPNTARGDAATPRDRRDAHSDTLRRAVEFIEANAHRDITLADIAASIPVTARAVQYAFTRHAGTTPLAHLRRVRLTRAHAELRAADPAGATTVAGVAGRWGFAHQGRFAAAYRQEYGVSPSVTLRSG